MKIDIQAQNSSKHENHQNLISSRHMYVKYKLKNTYISMHEGMWLKGCICIINSLDKIDIYMKIKHMIIETYPKWGIQVRMHESSKLYYTSTSNGYK